MISPPGIPLDARTDPEQRTHPAAVYWLVAIVLVGLGLRLFRLATWEIGLDEAYSANAAALALPDLLRLLATEDFHPPLHYLFLHFWRMLGTSETLLRLPSVVFGVLAIIVTYDLGRRLAGERTGLFAALFLALSPLHIYHAQEVRMYALLLLLAGLSLWFAARLMLGETHRTLWIGYVAATILALYTHYGAAIVLVGQNIAAVALYMLRLRRFIAQWIGGQLAILAGFLPWLLVFLTHASRTDAPAAGPSAGMSTVQQYAFVLSAFTSSYLPMGTPVLKAAVAGACLIIALLGAFALRRRLAAPILLVSSSLIALAIAAVAVGWRTLESIGTHVFIPRTLLAASIAYYVLIASGIVHIRPRRLAVALVTSVVAVSLASYPQLYYGIARSGPWREVANHVTTDLQAGDSVVFVSGFWARAFNFYFSADERKVPFVQYHSPIYIPEVERVVRGSRRVWLVLKQPQAVDPRGLVRSRLIALATLRSAEDYPFGIRIELYQVDKRP